ncbi:hypothetical protein BUALT_Bualt09G0060700 [Buddleja alternifolia]|uniref:O-fucosyltransferase family protein n=1 Tax=Buddleja alternifolia TaxID=168488 RepID=A0AAV6X7N0_9LAMI|nr:hypothetical protein BUALT_Bualt09G0060700 [Buddleja alternifolia]
MAVDLRQVMAAVLTFSMFIMLGNMIKRDHIDPLLEPLPASSGVHYDVLKVSKPGMVKLTEITYGPWQEQNEAAKPCWKKPSFKEKQQSNGYIFFSLTHGPEFHASQIANAVMVARYLGATLALPDIKLGSKLEEKRRFGEIYDADKFMASLKGVVRVDKNPPDDLSNGRLPIVKIPDRVSEDFIPSNIKPIFHSKRNLKIVTYFNSSAMAKGKTDKLSNPYQCLAMFESLQLQGELQEVVDSMVGTLRSLSKKMSGRFVAVDLRVDKLGEKGCQESDSAKKCYNAEEIGEFLKKIGFHKDTTVYLTQTGWHTSLNAVRNVFPNTFTKDAIMPADEKAKFMDVENHAYEKFIDYYMCTQGDAFIPAFPSKFYEGVVGERIGLGKTQIFVPVRNTSAAANEYISPYIAKKSHFAHSCFC